MDPSGAKCEQREQKTAVLQNDDTVRRRAMAGRATGRSVEAAGRDAADGEGEEVLGGEELAHAAVVRDEGGNNARAAAGLADQRLVEELACANEAKRVKRSAGGKRWRGGGARTDGEEHKGEGEHDEEGDEARAAAERGEPARTDIVSARAQTNDRSVSEREKA